MSTTNLFNCRFCLCETVEPRNMIHDGDFAQKSQLIFTEMDLDISQNNGLSVFVCEYCYNFISQFHAYYETVKENQEFLLSEMQDDPIKTEIISIEEPSEVYETVCPVIVETMEEIPEEEISVVPEKSQPSSILIDKNVIHNYKAGDATLEAQLNGHPIFICDYCDKYFFTKAQITGHIFKHLPAGPPKLPPNERPSYRRVPKANELTITCPYCPTSAIKFKNEDILKLHLTEHDRFERLSQHRIERGLPPLIECSHCERRLGPNDDIDSHLRNHEQERFMTCELCGRLIVSSSLKTHLKLHFKRYCCEFCSHKFRNRCDLVKHIQLNHERPERYECEHCNKKIKHKSAMDKHLQFCKGPNSVGPCRHCGQNFQSKSDRMYHVQKYHLGYVCKTCDMRLDGVTALKNHRKSMEHRKKSQEARERRKREKLGQLTTKKAPLRKVVIGVE